MKRWKNKWKNGNVNIKNHTNKNGNHTAGNQLKRSRSNRSLNNSNYTSNKKAKISPDLSSKLNMSLSDLC